MSLIRSGNGSCVDTQPVVRIIVMVLANKCVLHSGEVDRSCGLLLWNALLEFFALTTLIKLAVLIVCASVSRLVLPVDVAINIVAGFRPGCLMERNGKSGPRTWCVEQ